MEYIQIKNPDFESSKLNVEEFISSVASNSEDPCPVIDILTRAIMKLYEARDDEPVALFVAKSLILLHRIHCEHADIGAQMMLQGLTMSLLLSDSEDGDELDG